MRPWRHPTLDLARFLARMSGTSSSPTSRTEVRAAYAVGARPLRSRARHRPTPGVLLWQRWLGHRGDRIGSFDVQRMPVVQAWVRTTVCRNGQTMYDGITESIADGDVR